MGFFERLALKLLRTKLEGKVVGKIVRMHWPAVEETLNEELPPELCEALEPVELRDKAAQIAMRRLLEHMI